MRPNFLSKSDPIGHVGSIAFLIVMFAAFIGYVANVVKLIAGLGNGLTFEIGARAVGIIFAPLGMIFGFF